MQHKKTMRSMTCLIVAMLMTTTLLSACGGKNNGSTASPSPSEPTGNKKVELTLASIPGPVSIRLKSEADAFTKQNPNVTIKINEFAEEKYMDQGPRLFSSSEKPDLAWFWADSAYKKVADAGLLEPLDDLYQSEGWNNVLPESTIQRVKAKDGKMYAVNTEIVWGPIVYYNKEAFDKAGVQPPKTMDEFYAMGDKLKKAGYVPLVSGVSDIGILMFGGTLINSFPADEYAKYTKSIADPTFNYKNEKVAAAFDALKKMADTLMQKGAAGVNDNDARALFTQGKAAMYSGGSWSASDAILGKELPKNFKLGTFYYPQMYNDVPPKVAIYAGNSLIVMKGTGKEEWAKKFVAFVMSKDRQRELAAGKQFFPSRTDLTKEDMKPLGPVYMELYENMVKQGADNFWHTEVSGELSTKGREMVTAVMAGTKTGAQAGQELQKIMDKSK